VAFGERIQVNRQLLPESDIVRLVAEVLPLLKHFPPTAPPTFFEVVTVMALRYFAEQHCDLVIWETGLGGRLDATNIVTPLASVITNIAFDHQQWLGDTLPKIAAEKAGIIKPGVPVLTAADAPEALAVIRSAAASLVAPLTVVTSGDADHASRITRHVSLLGDHQRLNAALALATVRALSAQIPASDEHIRQGLAQVHWPGRFQVWEAGNNKTFVLDGAHNIAGAQCLRATLQKQFLGAKPALILGMLRDKDFSAMCETLAPLARRVVLTPVKSKRTATPDELIAACRRINPAAAIAAASSLADALGQVANESLILITGSLYLVGEAMELLKLSSTPSQDERGLNEWGGVP
jgi:dihydrofolate synthase/folylpolyglutamate synthase